MATLNVFFKVAEPVYSDTMAFSARLSQEKGSTFVIDGRTFFPHLSIYLLEVPDENVSKVIDASEKIAADFTKFSTKAGPISASDSGLIMLDIENTDALQQYHEMLVTGLNSFREGMLRAKYQDDAYMSSLDKKSRQYIQKYGHKYVFDEYSPHITVGRFEDAGAAAQVAREYCDTFLGREVTAEGLWIASEHFEPENYSEMVLKQVFIKE